MHQGEYTSYLVYNPRPDRHPSRASKAVDAWKADLISKKRPKIAASVAHPDVNPELFEEGWEQVLGGKFWVIQRRFLKIIDSLTSRGTFADERAVGRRRWSVGGFLLIIIFFCCCTLLKDFFIARYTLRFRGC